MLSGTYTPENGMSARDSIVAVLVMLAVGAISLHVSRRPTHQSAQEQSRDPEEEQAHLADAGVHVRAWWRKDIGADVVRVEWSLFWTRLAKRSLTPGAEECWPYFEHGFHNQDGRNRFQNLVHNLQGVEDGTDHVTLDVLLFLSGESGLLVDALDAARAGVFEWSSWKNGGQLGEARRPFAPVLAPAGEHISEWQVKLHTQHLLHPSWEGAREVECVTALRGVSNRKGLLDWCRPEPGGQEQERITIPLELRGQLHGKDSGWFINFMGFGGEDNDWTLDANTLGMTQGRVVGYQATPDGTHIDCVRFLLRDFAALPMHRGCVSQAFFSHTGQPVPRTFFRQAGPHAPDLAREIVRVLDKENLRTFYDVQNLLQVVGSQWARNLVKEAKRSSVFVAILTPPFSQRFWPMYELHLALEAAKQQPHSKRHIVPVLYGTTFKELRVKFESFDAKSSWGGYAKTEVVEDVVKSCVENLKALSTHQCIKWTAAGPFDDKNSIDTFGKDVASKIESLLFVGAP